MQITIKSKEDIKNLREGGRRLAEILNKIAAAARPGVSSLELDVLAEKLAREGGDEPAFLNYRARGDATPYPATLCVSINNEVVHGLPSKEKILKDGDIVSLDMGIKHKKLFTDMAVTVAVGEIDAEARKLLEVTKESLKRGIAAARAGARVGDISYAVESYIKPFKFGIVEGLAGHGVGYKVHEDPYVPNFGKKNTGPVLKTGMVIAIEPMVNEGTKNIVLDEDGFTYKTADGKRSAHFEHTVVITDKGAEILTD
jgi:methionyl aminopeptidase